MLFSFYVHSSLSFLLPLLLCFFFFFWFLFSFFFFLLSGLALLWLASGEFRGAAMYPPSIADYS